MIKPASLISIFKACSSPKLLLLPDAPHFTVAEITNTLLLIINKKENEIIGKGILEIFSAFENDGVLKDQLLVSLQNAVNERERSTTTIDGVDVAETVPILSDTGEIDYILLSYLGQNINKNNTVGTNTFCVDNRGFQDKNELEISDEKYRLLFQLSPLPRLVYELISLRILDVNEVALKKYGYSRNEFLKLTVPEIKAGNLISAPSFLRDKLANVDAPIYLGVETHIKKDKSLIEVEVSGNRFSFKGQECLMVICVDVTERERAIKQLKKSEGKLLAAQNIAKIGYWKYYISEDRLYWSDEVYRILGINKDTSKVNLDSFFNTLHPEDKQSFSEARTRAITGTEELNMEFRILLPDGTVKWIHEKGKLLKNERGEPLTFEGTIQDITQAKLLELSLEESNQRYEYVTKATFDAIWDWDLETDNNYWGEGFERTFGYDLATVRTDKNFWTSHIHPDDFDAVVNGIQKSIIEGLSNWTYEYRFQKANGRYAYVIDRCIIIRDKNEKAVRLVGAIQDISEKKALQELLDKANRLARIGSWEIDVQNASVYWSDITKEIRETDPGYQPSLADGIGHFKEGFSRDTIAARVKECIQSGKSWQEDLQIYTHKGNLKWIRTTGKAEMKEGECLKIYGSFQDIDASKKAELEILKLYEEKNTILESIDDGFFTIDRNWIVTYWNKQAELMLDTPKEMIVGKKLWDIFSPSANAGSYEKYDQALRNNKRILFEDYFDPLNRWFEISVYPSENGLSVYFKDITERRLSQIELRELNSSLQKAVQDLAVSNAELEQFAYIASHDLQEPLRMVTSFLAQLEKKYNDVLDEKGKQYIHFAVDGAKRMRQIILDLLEFSKVGRFEGRPQDVNVKSIVEEILSLFAKQIEETEATIYFHDLPVVQSFKSPLRQVIQNLLSNALKYHRAGESPIIHIESEELKDHWKFLVRDNGIGIGPDYYDRVFNIFQRLHNKEEYSGTGIGLAIVKKIVEAMGGEIWIEPNGTQGSIFIFTIYKHFL